MTLTVAPNLIAPDSVAGSMTSARETMPSTSLMRPSMNDCFSRA
jgi:hypothetical protein